MKSTSAFFTAVALLSATHATAEPIPPPATLAQRQVQYNATTYKGCYMSSGSGLSYNTSYLYSDITWCREQCVPTENTGYSVEGTTKGTDCWCGNELPASALVDDSNCNAVCAGYGTVMCGSADGTYISVYLTGFGTVGESESDSKPSTSSHINTPSPTTTAKPSTITVGGQTVVVTAPSSATTTAASTSKSPKASKAAIAVGVVVGIVALSAIAGGVYLCVRNKRRREVEEEYKRNAAVSQFISGGKPPTSSGGASSFTDTRLDPVLAHRRMSDGSIADNEDYSRRILKVTNA